ncbi:interferon-induced helicase C domain-containing protein 1 [Elysia marginata]|uniref:Interferon-induced helicase C domain-containing protein 1 n=1 Tax=Elysia marginata TaxID=1093978 RepID=A0AAV4HTZ4_9GAST|nr:interferon-induced helicase C domain-containing protein 1 [Elysia marginata]
MSESSPSFPPVFVTARDLPEGVTNYDLCAAGEKLIGSGGIIGSQRIGQLWRLYPSSREGRVKLLVEGLTIKNKRVKLLSQNPFLIRGNQEIPITKLFISNLPISSSNEMITSGLEKIGVVCRSNIFMERVRDPNGKLTHWLTGRRFIWIDVPKKPIRQMINIGHFKASLYYKEEKPASCRRCLREGHSAHQCTFEERCLNCGTSGHRKGDGKCKDSGDSRSKPEGPQ